MSETIVKMENGNAGEIVVPVYVARPVWDKTVNGTNGYSFVTTKANNTSYPSTNPSVSSVSNGIKYTMSSKSVCTIRYNTQIDFSKAKRIIISVPEIYDSNSGYTANADIKLQLTNDTTVNYDNSQFGIGVGDNVCDVSSYTGQKYINICGRTARSGTFYYVISNVYVVYEL